MPLAIRRISKNIDPQKTLDGILLNKWERMEKNGNLSIVLKSLFTKTLSFILISRSKLKHNFRGVQLGVLTP